jgi:ribosomal protein S18 acetylase RimI-like enzyme
MTIITVRSLEPDEWPLYREIRLTALTQAPEAFGSTPERERTFSEAQWRQRLTARNTLIAEAEDIGPCGLIGIVLDSDDKDDEEQREEEGSPVAELVSVWVAPAARGRGVGARLVTAAGDRATALGAAELRLWVAVDNPAAERLYRRLGFQRTGAVQPIRPADPRQELQMAVTLPLPG